MRKYSALFLVAFVLSSILFLQLPSTFNQKAIASTNTINCSCLHNGTSNIENKGGQVTKVNNNFTCKGAMPPGTNTCTNAEEVCINTPGHTYTSLTTGSNGSGRSCGLSGDCGSQTTTNWVGIECKSTISCTCNSNNQVVCTNPVLEAAGLPKSTYTQTFPQCSTDGSKICEKGPNLPTDAWNQKGYGAECQVNCPCDNPGKTGNNNNGWGHQKNSKCPVADYCGPKEDYCKNDLSAPGGHACVSSITCSCTNSNTDVYCSSPTSGDAPITIACGGGQQCLTGQQYGQQDIYNQTVYGAACVNVELPPPPSPPCAQWSGGQCVSFASGFGAFETDPAGFIQNVFAILLSVSGGIALLLIIRAGYQLMTSQGKPEQLQQGRDQLIAAIVGLVFLIFSFVFLELIGVDIFHIPGFSGANTGGTCAPNSCIQQSLCTAKNPGHCDTNGCPAGEACIQQ